MAVAMQVGSQIFLIITGIQNRIVDAKFVLIVKPYPSDDIWILGFQLVKFVLLVLSNHYRHYEMYGQNCQSFSSVILSVASPSAPCVIVQSTFTLFVQIIFAFYKRILN